MLLLGKKKEKANVLQVGSSLEPRDIKAEEHFEEMVPENGHRPCMNVIYRCKSST